MAARPCLISMTSASGPGDDASRAVAVAIRDDRAAGSRAQARELRAPAAGGAAPRQAAAARTVAEHVASVSMRPAAADDRRARS